MSLYCRYRKLRKENLLDIAHCRDVPAPDRKFLNLANEDFKEGVRVLERMDQANNDERFSSPNAARHLAGFAQDGARERSLNGQEHLRHRNVIFENG